MRLFAQNAVVARARFWYFMRTLKKLKKINGEIVAFHEIVERNDKVKNYGIWLRYNSRRATHNMYKEFRETSRAAAVTALYQDMAGRHRARLSTIQILDVKELAAKDCVRPTTQQFHNSAIKFPLPHRVLRTPHAKVSRKFLARRPSTHFH
jgi:large subunit ribosomal protein L18Ae